VVEQATRRYQLSCITVVVSAGLVQGEKLVFVLHKKLDNNVHCQVPEHNPLVNERITEIREQMGEGVDRTVSDANKK
jgi:hypothetical protein